MIVLGVALGCLVSAQANSPNMAPTPEAVPTGAPVLDAKPVVQEEPAALGDWSLGAGLIQLGGLSGQAVLERRLWDRGWLLVGATAGAESTEAAALVGLGVDAADASTTATRVVDSRAAVSLGMRMQLVGDNLPIRPSLFGTVLGGISSNEQLFDGSGGESDALLTRQWMTSADLQLGGMIDFELLRWLSLRFSSAVVSGSVARVSREVITQETQAEEDKSAGSGLRYAAGLTLTPAIQLQAFF